MCCCTQINLKFVVNLSTSIYPLTPQLIFILAAYMYGVLDIANKTMLIYKKPQNIVLMDNVK